MFEVQVRRYDDPDVLPMIEAVQREYVTLYGGPDEAVVDPREFEAPDGLFLVGLSDGSPVATGGWRVLRRAGAGATAEIKRMYVSAPARRRGLARQMLTELIDRARDAGVTELVLSTGERQPAAIALYESAGFEPAEPFGYYGGSVGAVFLARRLVPERVK